MTRTIIATVLVCCAVSSAAPGSWDELITLSAGQSVSGGFTASDVPFYESVNGDTPSSARGSFDFYAPLAGGQQIRLEMFDNAASPAPFAVQTFTGPDPNSGFFVEDFGHTPWHDFDGWWRVTLLAGSDIQVRNNVFVNIYDRHSTDFNTYRYRGIVTVPEPACVFLFPLGLLLRRRRRLVGRAGALFAPNKCFQ